MYAWLESKGFNSSLSLCSQSAEIGESMAKKFRSEVTSQIKMATAIEYGLMALGGFILLCLLVGLITCTIRKKVGTQNFVKSNTVSFRNLLKDSDRDIKVAIKSISNMIY